MSLLFKKPFVPETAIKTLFEEIVNLANEDILAHPTEFTTLYSIFGDSEVGGYKYYDQMAKLLKNAWQPEGLSVVTGYDATRAAFPTIHIIQQRLTEIPYSIGGLGSELFDSQFEGVINRGKTQKKTKFQANIGVFFTSKNQGEAYMMGIFFSQIIAAYKDFLLTGDTDVSSLSLVVNEMQEIYDGTNPTATGMVYSVPMDMTIDYSTTISRFTSVNVNLPTTTNQIKKRYDDI